MNLKWNTLFCLMIKNFSIQRLKVWIVFFVFSSFLNKCFFLYFYYITLKLRSNYDGKNFPSYLLVIYALRIERSVYWVPTVNNFSLLNFPEIRFNCSTRCLYLIGSQRSCIFISFAEQQLTFERILFYENGSLLRSGALEIACYQSPSVSLFFFFVLMR